MKQQPKQRKNIAGIDRVVLVASGKGGVGKSTIAANLAVALARNGFRVGFLDADIYGPSAPILFGIHSKVSFDDNYIIPHRKYGVIINSIGFLTEESEAVVWRGPLVTKMLYQLLERTRWSSLDEGGLDFLIIDTPPGTGDVHLSLAENYLIHSAIVISTPQRIALFDAIKGIDMFAKLQVPVLGVVVNMSYFASENSAKQEHIFGKGVVVEYLQEAKIPLIAQIPILKEISYQSDHGVPVSSVEANCKEARLYFDKIANFLSKNL